MNTVIACGGTGGHLFPGLAVAEVLRSRGHEVMLFVSEKEIDSRHDGFRRFGEMASTGTTQLTCRGRCKSLTSRETVMRPRSGAADSSALSGATVFPA